MKRRTVILVTGLLALAITSLNFFSGSESRSKGEQFQDGSDPDRQYHIKRRPRLESETMGGHMHLYDRHEGQHGDCNNFHHYLIHLGTGPVAHTADLDLEARSCNCEY